MKKITVIILAIMLCCCTFFTVHTEPESSIVMDFVSCNIGEDVEISLSLLNNPGIAALYFKVAYDKDSLVLNSVEDLELIDDFQYYDDLGTVTLSWEPAIENTFASGKLATFKFTVKEDAVEGISSFVFSNISHGIIDKDGNDVDINLISGSIKITHSTDIESSSLAIDKTNNYISAITAGTTVSEILSKLKYSQGVTLENAGKPLLADDKVTTGTKLLYPQDDGTTEYTLIITGDNSGDGKITVKDLLNLRAEINSPTLTDVYLCASDINGDKVVNEDDFDIIKSHILHNTEIIGISHLQ